MQILYIYIYIYIYTKILLLFGTKNFQLISIEQIIINCITEHLKLKIIIYKISLATVKGLYYINFLL